MKHLVLVALPYMSETRNMRLRHYIPKILQSFPSFTVFPRIYFDIQLTTDMSELRNCWCACDVTDSGVLQNVIAIFPYVCLFEVVYRKCVVLKYLRH